MEGLNSEIETVKGLYIGEVSWGSIQNNTKSKRITIDCNLNYLLRNYLSNNVYVTFDGAVTIPNMSKLQTFL